MEYCDLHISRAFHWGIVILGDAEAMDIPQAITTRVTASDSAAVVAVHHAQDVPVGGDEFKVEVCVKAGRSELAELAFDGVLQIRSGRLEVGDADEWEALRVEPGSVRLQISASPAESPDAVQVWVSSV